MERVKSILAVVLSAAIGGVAGGLAVGWSRTPADTPKPSATSAGALAGDLDELENRVEMLEKQVERLQQYGLRQIQMPLAVPAGAASGEGEPRDQKPVIDTPVFEAAVRDVLDRIQQERVSDRNLRNDQRRESATQQWADRFAKQAELSEEQKAKVLQIAQEYAQLLRQARESDAGPTTREESQTRRNALREQSEKRLNEVLSARQMQSYRQSEDLRLDRAARGTGRSRNN